MRIFLSSLRSLSLWLCSAFTILFTVVGSAAAEVTVSLAVPGDPISRPLKTIEFTASQIDTVLGNTQFTTLANGIFTNLEDLRAALAQETAVQVGNFAKVKRVNSVTVSFAPLIIKARQLSSGIGVDIKNIEILVDFLSTKPNIPLVCQNARVIALFHVVGTSFASLPDLTLSPVTVPKPKVEVVEARCTGPLRGLFNLLGSELTQIIEKLAEKALRKMLPEQLNFTVFPAMFSLAELTAKIDRALPPGPIKDKVIAAVDHLVLLATQPAHLELEMMLHPNMMGAGRHFLRLTASSQPPSAVVTTDYPIVTWFGGTAPYDVYFLPPAGAGAGSKVATTTGHTWVGPAQARVGSRVLVVSHNPIIPGLRSFPAQASVDFVPGGADCPQCILR